MNFFQKTKLFWLLNKARKQMNLSKLNKSELWVTVVSTALLTILTQIDVDPELARNLIASITVIASSYIGSRGYAKGKAGDNK